MEIFWKYCRFMAQRSFCFLRVLKFLEKWVPWNERSIKGYDSRVGYRKWSTWRENDLSTLNKYQKGWDKIECSEINSMIGLKPSFRCLVAFNEHVHQGGFVRFDFLTFPRSSKLASSLHLLIKAIFFSSNHLFVASP